MPLGILDVGFARHKHPKRNGPRRVVLRPLEVIRLCSGDLGLRLIVHSLPLSLSAASQAVAADVKHQLVKRSQFAQASSVDAGHLMGAVP